MRVWGIFHGGHNYSAMITAKNVESFSSLKAAKDAFWSRTDFDPYYPCTDETASMQIFFADPLTGDEADDDFVDCGYPDREITLGPRGGIRCSCT